MIARNLRYGLLVGFAAVMVALLMVDEPQAQRVQLPEPLFPELTAAAQINGLEVLDVTSGKGILLVRNDTGMWYAPAISGTQTALAAEKVNQVAVENAAAAVWLMDRRQSYANTLENRQKFGLESPQYLIRFQAHDVAGRSYAPVIIEIGNANPDNVAYYVLPQGEANIYLIRKPIVDMLLNLLDSPTSLAPNSDVAPTDLPENGPTF